MKAMLEKKPKKNTKYEIISLKNCNKLHLGRKETFMLQSKINQTKTSSQELLEEVIKIFFLAVQTTFI